MELKHLAAYLPYGVKVDLTRKNYERKNVKLFGSVFGYNETTKEYWILKEGVTYAIEHIKPNLRPLSDLTKEIEENGEKFVPLNEILNCEYYGSSDLKYMVLNNNFYSIKGLGYETFQKLLEWKFDVFGLIEKGEAIDINTLDL